MIEKPEIEAFAQTLVLPLAGFFEAQFAREKFPHGDR